MLRANGNVGGVVRLVGGSGIAEAESTATTGPRPSTAKTSVVALPLGISLAILFLTYWCVDIVSPTLPAIRDALALSATGAGLVFSVFFAGRLIANVPAAMLVDRVGPKWTAVAGAATLGVGSVLVATATTSSSLLPARGIQGAGVAILATAGLLSVLRVLPGGGAAMTAFNVSIGLGGSAGLLCGGYLTTELGWRAVFWLSTALSVVLLGGSLLARARAATPRLDRQSPRESDSDDHVSRGAEMAAIAANLLVFANYAIWLVALPLLAAVKFGFDAGQIGLVLLFVNVVHLVSAVPVGGVIRIAGSARTLAVGFGLSGVAMLLVPLAPNAQWLLGPMALYAVGQVAGNSSAGDLILRLGGGGGRAVGAVRLSSDIGLVVGPAAAGMVADTAGVTAPFVALGILVIAASITMVVFGGTLRRR